MKKKKVKKALSVDQKKLNQTFWGSLASLLYLCVVISCILATIILFFTKYSDTYLNYFDFTIPNSGINSNLFSTGIFLTCMGLAMSFICNILILAYNWQDDSLKKSKMKWGWLGLLLIGPFAALAFSKKKIEEKVQENHSPELNI